MSKQLLFRGVISEGIQWATMKWNDMISAHAGELPQIAEMTPGTFNIGLIEPATWTPDRDDELRLKAREHGIATRIGFRKTGNYVHPDYRVIQIGETSVTAWLYFPGVSMDVWPIGEPPPPIARPRLELISESRLRDSLSDSVDGAEVDVIVERCPH